MASSRPALLTDLFYRGRPYPGWDAYNWKKRRFYVLNATRVLGRLRAEPTRSGADLREARRRIETETEWPAQFKATYEASRVQFYPDQVWAPKYLEKAATLVVALEVMAERLDPEFNVYRHVRIAPAFYFLDEFDRDRLRQLSAAYDEVKHDGKPRLFTRPDDLGPRPDADFQEAAMAWLGQPSNSPLLREMSSGYCATEEIVLGVQRFVDAVFGGRFVLGRMMGAGDPAAARPELGALDAAPSLRPPVLEAE